MHFHRFMPLGITKQKVLSCKIETEQLGCSNSNGRACQWWTQFLIDSILEYLTTMVQHQVLYGVESSGTISMNSE
jgi:hypothetical protein